MTTAATQPPDGNLDPIAVSDAYNALWEGREAVAPDVFERVLKDAFKAVEAEGVPFVLMGGIASSVHGRPRWTHDIDLFVKVEDARRALEALAGAGFDTAETYPHWLYKAVKDGALVDVIFRSCGDIYLDDEMLERAVDATFKGIPVRVLPAEDLLVIKAVVHDEHMPRHWHDGLGLIASGTLDWDYLLRRARRHGPRRVLALLVYAQSNDLVVPDRVIRELFDVVYSQS